MGPSIATLPSDQLAHSPAPIIDVVDHDMAAVLHAKTPAQRLQIAFGLWQFVRHTLLRRLAAKHPDWTPEQVSCEVARRLQHDT